MHANAYNHGALNSASDALNRIQQLCQDNLVLASYSYLGQNRVVIASYPGQPAVQLSYFTSAATGEAGDPYTGLDRFGRIIDQRWQRTSTQADLERVQYGYNRASTRTWRRNLVAGGYAG